MKLFRFMLLITVPLAAGCASPIEAEQTLSPTFDGQASHLRTDSTSYTLNRSGAGWETEIGFRFTNPLDETIYVVNCHRILTLLLQRLEGDEWVTVWAPITPACLSPPIRIDPGSTYRTDYRIWGAEPGQNIGPEFTTTDLAGTYRLHWVGPVLNYRDAPGGFGDRVPEGLLISNTFELRQGG